MGLSFSISRWLRPAWPSCVICGRESAPGQAGGYVRHPQPASVLQWLCRSCRTAIPWIAKPACRICGRPEACPDCPRRANRSLQFSRCAVRYDDKMKDLLALYKYRGSEKLEFLMAAILAAAFERIGAELASRGTRPRFHMVASVPLARERLEERGFNQAERMAEILAGWYGLVHRPLLRRNRHTEKQSLKNRRTRLSDMRGNFSPDMAEIRAIAPPDVAQGPVRVLLIDDIYTTGSTLNECAAALRTAFCETLGIPPGYLEIYGLVWARS